MRSLKLSIQQKTWTVNFMNRKSSVWCNHDLWVTGKKSVTLKHAGIHLLGDLYWSKLCFYCAVSKPSLSYQNMSLGFIQSMGNVTSTNNFDNIGLLTIGCPYSNSATTVIGIQN